MGLTFTFQGTQKVCEECGRVEEELEKNEKMIKTEDFTFCSECSPHS